MLSMPLHEGQMGISIRNDKMIYSRRKKSEEIDDK